MGISDDLRVLMITPLDYHQAINNREHNMVRHFSKMGCQITMIYKAMNRSLKIKDLMRDIVMFRVSRIKEGEAEFLRVSPFFNYFAGLRVHSDAAASKASGKYSSLSVLVKFFSKAAFVRDLFSVPCMLLAGLFGASGHFQVCIGFGPWGALTGWMLKKLGKADTLVYEDRDYEPGLVPDKFRRMYTSCIENKLLNRADVVVSIGYRLARLRESQTGRPVTVIPTGVNWDLFGLSRDMKKDAKVLIYVGNVISWCGVEMAIISMKDILKIHDDAKLVILGDGLGSYVDYLKGLAAKLGLDEKVVFLGRKPYSELPSILGKAMIGLANSQPIEYRKFAYPLKVIEYMAAGLPVIGTTGTETEEIIERCKCGISVPYEEGALANAVIRLLDDKALYEELRNNGIRESSQMTWDKLLEKEIGLIKGSLE